MFKICLIVLLAGTCLGVPNHPDSRIIGGEDADEGEVPVIVSLRYSRSKSHICGGAVLNENWIITAAHCIIGDEPSDFIVVSGSNKLNSGGVERKVSKVVVNKNFDPYFSTEYDIGLLKLAEPLEFSDLIQPVVLPEADSEQGDGFAVRAVGWGYTTFPELTTPNNLQKIELKVVNNEACQEAFGIYEEIFPSNICAGGEKGRSVCNGDSGSPLLASGSNTIVGIVSWGEPCAQGVPDVYTRVSKYIDWISANAV